MKEPIEPIPLSLVNELLEFCNVMDLQMKGSKAIRVINKCIQRGHYDLADKIGLKYRRILPKYDIIVAMQMSIGYSKEREGKSENQL